MHEAKESYRLGESFVQIEGDVFFIRAAGTLTEENARDLVLHLKRISDRQGRVFILGDLKNAGNIPPAARRILIAFGVERPAAAIAFYSVGLFTKGLNALLFGALNLLGKQPPNMRQFSTEHEARAWLEAERRRLFPPAD